MQSQNDMYGIVVAVEASRYEMTIEEVEQPWKRKDGGQDGRSYEELPEDERGRAIGVHGHEAQTNRRTGRLWVYGPVRAAEKEGLNSEGVEGARRLFRRFHWCVGQEVSFRRGDDDGAFTVGRVGKWFGRASFYGNDVYGYGSEGDSGGSEE